MPLKEYLLFIDTETSGLPKKWHLPYNAPGNWPYAVQVSWLVYTKEGQKIKEENHYVSDDDFEVSTAALRIHGLTTNFLQHTGIPLSKVLQLLSKDLDQYQPMVVGHFIELDYRVIGAGYYRQKISNPMESLSTFCIMKATQHLQQNPHSKFLRLGDLYQLLFKQPLLCQHNALVDAAATADCFFELVKINGIQSFEQPSILFTDEPKLTNTFGWVLVFLIFFFSAFLIACYYG